MAKRKKKKVQQPQTSFNWSIIGGTIIAVLLVLIGGYFVFFADNPAPAAQGGATSQQSETVTEDTSDIVSVEAPSPSLPVRPQVGALAPDFTLVATTGEQISLADYQGKPVVVSFFHTW
jgi:cytochrome oxidase Cu insertion factor (SCO1/SenC/PrrC family)